MHSLPHYQHSPPEEYICYNWQSYIDIIKITPSWSCTVRSLLVLYPLWVWMCGQVYNGMCPTLLYDGIVFSLSWKSTVLSLFIPPFHPLPLPLQLLIFFLSPLPTLFQNLTELESYSLKFVQIGFFHLIICIQYVMLCALLPHTLLNIC